jgi:hypothetical protein
LTGLELERNQRERDVKIVNTLDHEVHIYSIYLIGDHHSFSFFEGQGHQQIASLAERRSWPEEKKEEERVKEEERRKGLTLVMSSDISEVSKSRTLPAETSRVSFWHPH